MGGEVDNFGLWIDTMLRNGSCAPDSCTTFQDYTPLSASNIFTIKTIEVWAVGESPQNFTLDVEVC